MTVVCLADLCVSVFAYDVCVCLGWLYVLLIYVCLCLPMMFVCLADLCVSVFAYDGCMSC